MATSHTAGRLRFFGQWLRNPRQTAAIAPSSTELIAAVLATLPQGAARIIELGGGSGAITHALLASGISARDLLVLELNRHLHARLQARFPSVETRLGDALHTYEIARDCGFTAQGQADAVISDLGLLGMGRETQSAILQSAFACIKPGGVMIQFTNGPMSPVGDAMLVELGLSAQRGVFVLRSVPPTTLWVFRRSRSKAIKPRSVARKV